MISSMWNHLRIVILLALASGAALASAPPGGMSLGGAARAETAPAGAAWMKVAPIWGACGDAASTRAATAPTPALSGAAPSPLFASARSSGDGSPDGSRFAPLPGFPVNVGTWCRKPVIADLRGDGQSEIILGGGNGTVHVLGSNGVELPGWPKTLGLGVTSPAVADLDHDGVKEIIIAETTAFGGYFPNGRVHVFRPDGSYVPGWPVVLDGGVIDVCSVSVGDIDGDGTPEILIGTGSSYGSSHGTIYYRKLYAFRPNGTVVPGWPVQTGDTGAHIALCPRSTPVLADLDGDGDPEIVIGCLDNANPNGTQNCIDAFHHDGTRAAGFPVYDADWNYCLAAADFNEDGQVEIVSHGHMYNGHGQPVASWMTQSYVISDPGLGDVTHDGHVDYAYGRGGTGEVNLVDETGHSFPGWPVRIEASGSIVDGNPLIVDLDGDGVPEIVIGAYQMPRLHALHIDGTEVAGFPITTGAADRAVCAGDIDGDGTLDLLSAGDDGMIYAWRMGAPYHPTDAQWTTYQGDNQRTGFYRSQWAASVDWPSDGANGAGAGSLLHVSPNPMAGGTVITWRGVRIPAGAGAYRGNASDPAFDVFDTSGRLIRRLAATRSEAGATGVPISAVWDGATDDGSRAPAGVYFCRVPGVAESERIVIVR